MRKLILLFLGLSLLGCKAAGKFAEQGLGDLVGEEKAESIMKVAEAAASREQVSATRITPTVTLSLLRALMVGFRCAPPEAAEQPAARS